MCLYVKEGETAKDGDVLLNGDPKRAFGRLKIFKDGEWSTVCSQEWAKDNKGAQNICR